jgi:hypothetical protein
LRAYSATKERAGSEHQTFGKTAFILPFYNLRLHVLVENGGVWHGEALCGVRFVRHFCGYGGQQLTTILRERLSRAVLTWNEQ